MELIGMLDSPYVRRVALALTVLGLPFRHRPLSVLRQFEDFAAINPVVKAPTLITDDQTVLMESSQIITYASQLVGDYRLLPADRADLARAQRITALALAACEKTVQLVYERHLRPADKQYQPWLDRVTSQLTAAYRLLEAEIINPSPWLFGAEPLEADITAAVAWRFTTEVQSEVIDPAVHPALNAFAIQAEATPLFAAFPPV